jgi:cell division control protein 7
MLEPASYAAASQLSALTTDTCQGGGRTPLLRASVTSTCSSAALPAVTPAAAAAAAATTVLPPSSKHQLSRGGSASNVTSSRATATTPCGCVGRPRVCGACLELQHMHAARAGTPGFRPPEVLLKHAGQTTAIDLWAVGVMLLCILSRSYPFFRAPDDLTALAELTVLFGSRAVKETAKRYGRRLLTSQESEPKNLGFLCK